MSEEENMNYNLTKGAIEAFARGEEPSESVLQCCSHAEYDDHFELTLSDGLHLWEAFIVASNLNYLLLEPNKLTPWTIICMKKYRSVLINNIVKRRVIICGEIEILYNGEEVRKMVGNPGKIQLCLDHKSHALTDEDMSEISARTGHRFVDVGLARTAHRAINSCARQVEFGFPPNYERFCIDHYTNAVARKFPRRARQLQLELAMLRRKRIFVSPAKISAFVDMLLESEMFALMVSFSRQLADHYVADFSDAEAAGGIAHACKRLHECALLMIAKGMRDDVRKQVVPAMARMQTQVCEVNDLKAAADRWVNSAWCAHYVFLVKKELGEWGDQELPMQSIVLILEAELKTNYMKFHVYALLQLNFANLLLYFDKLQEAEDAVKKATHSLKHASDLDERERKRKLALCQLTTDAIGHQVALKGDVCRLPACRYCVVMGLCPRSRDKGPDPLKNDNQCMQFTFKVDYKVTPKGKFDITMVQQNPV